MTWTVWFYDLNEERELAKSRDCFTGTLAECRKWKKGIKNFSWQYVIHKNKEN